MSKSEAGIIVTELAGKSHPPPLRSQLYRPISIPCIVAPRPSLPNPANYCCSLPYRTAVFCGLRKSLREILNSKHTSSMYSLVPMMYSQDDLFYSSRSRQQQQGQRRDGPGNGPVGPTELGSGSSVWKGIKTLHAPYPTAHLHFNSAVRQAVEKYSDVLSSMKCHHMDNIIREVMRLCPLLKNDVAVKNRVKRAIKSYICNAVTHYKRKQRNKSLDYNEIKHSDSASSQVGQRPSISRASSPNIHDFFGRSSGPSATTPLGSSYQNEFIDFSKPSHAVSATVGNASPQESAEVCARSSSFPSLPRETTSLTTATDRARHHSSERRTPDQANGQNQCSDPEMSDTPSTNMDSDANDCKASSSGDKAEGDKGFHYSDGPSFEELRGLQADFAKQRDWDQFHQPRNLLLAMIAEVGEVSELFQWRGECKEGLEDWSEKDKKHLGQEMSDVLLYLIRLADKCHVDLPSAVMDKMGLNAKKYPVHKVYGSSKKYTEYE